MKKLICKILTVILLVLTVPAVYASEKTTLEVGDLIIIGTYKGEPVEYKVMGTRDVDGDGSEELFLAASKIISFKAFNSGATPNYAVCWKSNHLERQPSLRIWLNSAKTEVDYGTESDGSTAVVPSYADEPGFLTGMNETELAQIVPVTHNSHVADFLDTAHEILPIDGGAGHFVTYNQGFPKAYTNNLNTAVDYDNAAYVTTTDKVFIPSVKDLYDFFGGKISNNEAIANLNVGATEIAQEEAGSEALYTTSNTLLRDVYFGNNIGESVPFRWNGTYVMHKNPLSSPQKAVDLGGVRPCMYIKADTAVEETFEESGVYQVKLPIRASISVQQEGAEIVEIQQGEITVSGSARADVDTDIIAAVFRCEDGIDVMEDYVRTAISDNINITLISQGSGNRYVGLFFRNSEGKGITSTQFIGGAPSVIWTESDEVSEIQAATAVEGEIIRVSGVLPDGSGSNVGVVAKKSDSDIVAYANQFSVGEKNKFELAFAVETLFGGTEQDVIEGWYDIIITTDIESKNVKAGIAGPGVWTNVLEKINDGENDFVTSVFLNREGYELEYNSLTDKGFYLDEYTENSGLLDETLEKLISNKPSRGYTTETAVEAFNRYITCALFDGADSTEKFSVIENDRYDEILGVDGIKESESYITAKKLNNAEKIFDKVTSENIRTKVFENIILMTIDNAENSKQIQTVIEEYAEKIGLEFKTGYKNLSGTTLKKLYDVYFDKTVNDIDDVIDVFEDAYEDVTSTKTSTGGGGGSSSSGALGIKRPQTSVTPEKNEDENITKPEEGGKVALKDADKLTWAKEAVLYLVEKGIISGNENGEFCPEDNITREQFAKIAVLAFGVTADGNMEFSDVQDGAWYESYVNTLASAGIVNGINDSQFGVERYITRQDLAVIAYRILKNEGKIEKSNEMGFADGEKIADYAREAVCSLAAAGFVNGYDDNTFRGECSITRQEAAQIIYNIIGGAK